MGSQVYIAGYLETPTATMGLNLGQRVCVEAQSRGIVQ